MKCAHRASSPASRCRPTVPFVSLVSTESGLWFLQPSVKQRTIYTTPSFMYFSWQPNDWILSNNCTCLQGIGIMSTILLHNDSGKKPVLYTRHLRTGALGLHSLTRHSFYSIPIFCHLQRNNIYFFHMSRKKDDALFFQHLSALSDCLEANVATFTYCSGCAKTPQ